jgi:phosphate-transporting ATPase
VVLLDEPTSGLDEDARHGAETLLLEHFRSGLSALWVTHDDAQARRVAERSLAVSDGRAQEAAA